MVGRREKLGAGAGPLVSDHQSESGARRGTGGVRFAHARTGGIGNEEGQSPAADPLEGLRGCQAVKGKRKGMSRRGANRLGVPQIDRSVEGDHARGSEGGRGSHEGSRVARILHGVEHQDPLPGFQRPGRSRHPCPPWAGEPPLTGEFVNGLVGNAEYALGSLRIAETQEGLRGHPHHVDPRGGKSFGESDGVGRGIRRQHCIAKVSPPGEGRFERAGALDQNAPLADAPLAVAQPLDGPRSCLAQLPFTAGQAPGSTTPTCPGRGSGCMFRRQVRASARNLLSPYSRTMTPLSNRLPIALTIAGSDSGGGAGIQADLKTFHAHRIFGTSVITAITAQNTTGVAAVHPVPLEVVRAQLDALAEDLPPRAVKSGMLATAALVETVARAMVDFGFENYVLDPVMVASTGARLLDEDAVDAVRTLLLPLAGLVTPNLHEARILTDIPVQGEKGQRAAARRLVELGAAAALVKGGHGEGDELIDLFWDGTRERVWRHPRLATRNTHGTGCTLSAAIAAGLAGGRSLPEAVGSGLGYVARAIESAPELGRGHGPVNHFAAIEPALAADRETE
jgi:hydroxymethylpyrimidine/phosphomethylpyrimidine kinase